MGAVWLRLRNLGSYLRAGRSLWHLASASPWWIAACSAQAAWTVCFSKDQVVLSMAPMLGIAYSMGGLCNLLPNESASLTCGYVLGRLPFVMHFSWVCCATILNANLAAVALAGPRYDSRTVVNLARVSLAIAVAVGGTIAYRSADPVPALVTAWALIAIRAKELTKAASVEYVFQKPILQELSKWAAIGAGSMVCLAGVLAFGLM